MTRTRKPSKQSRKVAKGSTVEPRVGGDRFELTHAFAGGLTRVATLRAHMRLFFRVPKRALLDDVAAIYDELLEASGSFQWLEKTTSQMFAAATPSAIARARTRFACPNNDSCWIGLKSCQLAGDVAERRLDVVVHPRGSSSYAFAPSVIQMTFAPDVLDLAFRDRFVASCARLPMFLCGTAGYYLDTTPAPPATVLARIVELALAHRGLELPGTANGHDYTAPNWISGVNWLTAVGAGACGVLGDKRLAAPIECHRAGDVLVLQAGPRPELGRDGIPPKAYQQVHDFLDRPTTLVGLPTNGDARFNVWHRRYT